MSDDIECTRETRGVPVSLVEDASVEITNLLERYAEGMSQERQNEFVRIVCMFVQTMMIPDFISQQNPPPHQ